MSEQTTSEKIAAAGIKRPINWDEMSSSGKDMWEEKQLRGMALSARLRARRQVAGQ